MHRAGLPEILAAEAAQHAIRVDQRSMKIAGVLRVVAAGRDVVREGNGIDDLDRDGPDLHVDADPAQEIAHL